MEKICRCRCGNKVRIPAKISKGDFHEVKCARCGAQSLLKVRRRNGNVKGLKEGLGYKLYGFFK